MGTYTTNYSLFMPSVGERGWGTLINGNYDTIDTTMKGLDTRLTAVENEVNGNLSCTSVATSGTITSNGMLNANGGVNGGAITGTTITATTKFVGTLYGKVYVNAKTSGTKYNNDVTYATCAAQSLNVTPSRKNTTTNSSTMTVGGYSKISLTYPYQLYPGIYIPSSAYFTDNVPSGGRTATLRIVAISSPSINDGYCHGYLYVNGTQVTSVSAYLRDEITSGTVYASTTYTLQPGDSVYIAIYSISVSMQAQLIIPAGTTHYINVV